MATPGSLAFDVNAAVRTRYRRSEKMRTQFMGILKKCLARIEEAAHASKWSIIYTPPRSPDGQFRMDDLIIFLIHALRDDRGYQVRVIPGPGGKRRLFIAWISKEEVELEVPKKWPADKLHKIGYTPPHLRSTVVRDRVKQYVAEDTARSETMSSIDWGDLE